MEAPRPSPVRSILVPVDFSGPSLQAWAEARQLGAALGASLEAVYVYESNVAPGRGVVSLTETAERLKGHLRQCLGREARVSVREGRAASGIAAAAREAGSGLIVMGSRGRSGLSRAALGSVAEGVSRLASCPVLTLREAGPLPRVILAPVNFQPYALRVLFDVSRLAEALGARVDALVVREGARAGDLGEGEFRGILARLAPCFRGRPPSLLMREGDAAEEISLAAQRCDWVALAAHRRPGLKSRVLGSTAERVLRACGAPVLCFPSDEPVPAQTAGAPAEDARKEDGRKEDAWRTRTSW